MIQFRNLFRGLLLVTALAGASGSLADSNQPKPAGRGELAAYVARPDASFGWKEVATGRLGSAEYAEYLMTSQTWRGITWKHQLYVLRPANMTSDTRQGMLFIHGGRWKPEYETERHEIVPAKESLLFLKLAEAIRAPVVILAQVPFQPIFDRTEDAAIAYTFNQYLQTGDSDWPLLLPMVKSATRAMDAAQSIVKERWGTSLDSFTVSGASKRGWTTWLTAATDKRVKAAAPIVIDVLNMAKQMEHQRATWGEFSDEIADYSNLDLQAQLKTERGKALLSMVDPYSYRTRYTQPKLILLSTNDRYWPLDALKLYWPELPNPKHVLYIPNQGHGLADPDRVIGGLSALHRYSAAGKLLPRTNWSFGFAKEVLTIDVKADRPTQHVLMWSARSPTRDMRNAYWTSTECEQKGNRHACSVNRGDPGYLAAFAETSFLDEGSPAFSTTTTVCIMEPKASAASGC